MARITIANIQQATADAYGVPLGVIKGRSKAPEACEARHTAMFLSRVFTAHSLPAIGRYFGRDHSTVLSGIRRATGRLADPATRDRILRAVQGMGVDQ